MSYSHSSRKRGHSVPRRGLVKHGPNTHKPFVRQMDQDVASSTESVTNEKPLRLVIYNSDAITFSNSHLRNPLHLVTDGNVGFSCDDRIWKGIIKENDDKQLSS